MTVLLDNVVLYSISIPTIPFPSIPVPILDNTLTLISSLPFPSMPVPILDNTITLISSLPFPNIPGNLFEDTIVSIIFPSISGMVYFGTGVLISLLPLVNSTILPLHSLLEYVFSTGSNVTVNWSALDHSWLLYQDNMGRFLHQVADTSSNLNNLDLQSIVDNLNTMNETLQYTHFVNYILTMFILILIFAHLVLLGTGLFYIPSIGRMLALLSLLFIIIGTALAQQVPSDSAMLSIFNNIDYNLRHIIDALIRVQTSVTELLAVLATLPSPQPDVDTLSSVGGLIWYGIYTVVSRSAIENFCTGDMNSGMIKAACSWANIMHSFLLNIFSAAAYNVMNQLYWAWHIGMVNLLSLPFLVWLIWLGWSYIKRHRFFKRD